MGEGERPSALLRPRGSGQPPKVIRPILTAEDVCRLLRRSKRQVYRYLKAGRLQPCARILGQWLFSAEEVRRFQRDRIPSFLKPFFWDARMADLSSEHHRDFILARVLESGDRKAVRWALRTYPKQTVLSFLKDRGKAALSERAQNFWLSVLGEALPRRDRPDWRRQGRRWGGIS